MLHVPCVLHVRVLSVSRVRIALLLQLVFLLCVSTHCQYLLAKSAGRVTVDRRSWQFTACLLAGALIVMLVVAAFN